VSEKLVNFSEHRRPRRRKCPICGRPPLAQHEPFCSKRCADEDLRRWLTGGYRIPTKEVPGQGGEGGEGE
jgi:hypothetical protein